MNKYGVWEARESSEGCSPQVYCLETKDSKNGFLVALAQPNLSGISLEEANLHARLMAAAPDLWEACHLALEYLDISRQPALELRESLENAIRKAE